MFCILCRGQLAGVDYFMWLGREGLGGIFPFGSFWLLLSVALFLSLARGEGG